jgi:hypothetical protein
MMSRECCCISLKVGKEKLKTEIHYLNFSTVGFWQQGREN